MAPKLQTAASGHKWLSRPIVSREWLSRPSRPGAAQMVNETADRSDPIGAPWREFELAVAEFIRKLDPEARVTHNFHQADQQTGKRRQRDVWVETTVLKHFPITI